MDEQPYVDMNQQETRDLADTLGMIANQSREMVSGFLREHYGIDYGLQIDPLNIGGAFFDLTTRLMTGPAVLMQAQMSLWRNYMDLWQSTTRRMMGEDMPAAIAPEPHDHRFDHQAWEDNQLFDYIKQSYLLTARWLHSTAHNLQGENRQETEVLDFFTRQFVDAMAPSNFLFTNPEVQRATIESSGQNLLKGLEHLLHNLSLRGGRLEDSMADDTAFVLGQNLACTPGKVIFENELMQLLQYSPTTETVAKRPVLVVPPWMNKYYVLDLRQENSFIRWMVDQGLTVFCISWVNPDERLAQKTFENYMIEGPVAALGAIRKICGKVAVNCVGYCLGGTLLSVAQAYLAAKKQPLIHSASFITTLTDFSDPGELAVFIDEEQVTLLEKEMARDGGSDGTGMIATLRPLRANDLIWSFVVDNYLLGKEPFPVDLHYWNEDATRVPAVMHAFYLRRMYLENLLSQPGGITLDAVPIDLARIETPIFMVAAKEDHLVPWRAAYNATELFKGPVHFVLTAGGHVSGVLNPPDRAKYPYWTNSRTARHPETWFRNAKKHDGSWWDDWAGWLRNHRGREVPAREPGSGPLKASGDAPGSYVAVKLKS